MPFRNLKTKFLGKNIYHYEKIDSTQKEIWRRIEEKQIENGTIILADSQTEGIGTHGRTWYTDTKNNIAFSFFLQTDCKLQKLEGLTLEIAQTIVETFQQLYQITLNIKLPNDIVYQNKKIGGILTQTKVQNEKVKCIVIGIGINTNQEKFVEEIKDLATSIKKEFLIKVENEAVITRFCELFEKKLIERNIINEYQLNCLKN